MYERKSAFLCEPRLGPLAKLGIIYEVIMMEQW